MSMEIDSLKPQKTKKHKKSDGEKGEKKRKRKTSETFESTSPTKKHRSQAKGVQLQTHILRPTLAPKTSPFYEQRSSLYLPIAPIAQHQPIQALCAEHLSPLILSYYPPFHGVVISYSNPRCHSNPDDIATADGRQRVFARSVDEYAASFVWLSADFLIFRPRKGDVIEGQINLQNENNIGIVYWNFFNASIERRRLPSDWLWVPGGMTARRNGQKLKKPAKGSGDTDEEDGEDDIPAMEVEADEGHFRDGNGKRIEGVIQFWVRHVETSRSMDRENGFLSVEGTLLNPREEGMSERLLSMNGDFRNAFDLGDRAR